MNRKKAFANPTNLDLLLRKPARPVPYRWYTRWADRWSGRSDGQIALAGRTAEQQRSINPDDSPWLRHNLHELANRQHGEELVYEATALKLQARAETVRADLVTAEEALLRVQSLRDSLPDDLEPEALKRRRATEVETPAEIIAMRRRREYQVTVRGPVQSQLDAARATVTRLSAELHDLEGTITQLEEVLTTRRKALTEHHGRRASIYERSYLRAAARRGRGGDRPALRSA